MYCWPDPSEPLRQLCETPVERRYLEKLPYGALVVCHPPL